jgi:uncharacterized repeat protein (TIGR01451 family)
MLFIESNVPEIAQLIGYVPDDIEVTVLDANADGLRQIALALRGRKSISTIHLITHGAPGSLDLGTLDLNNTQLPVRTAELATIRNALADDAEILLYGCEVARGWLGKQFVGALSRATGARVAASTGLTGASDRGGDWILEKTSGASGSSAAATLAFPYYRHVLATVAGVIRTGPQEDGRNFGPVFTDDESPNDLPGVTYQIYFADYPAIATPKGVVSAISLQGLETTVYYELEPDSYLTGPISALVLKTAGGQHFSLSSFLIQDNNGVNATYKATGYRNGAAIGYEDFTIPMSGSYSRVMTLGAAFYDVDEVRVTSDGGSLNEVDMLAGESFNNFVVGDPVASNDANLTALALSTGTLAPAFSAGTTAYSVSVGNASTSTTITPTVSATGLATASVNGTPVPSGTPSPPVPLAVGTNTITITVTAQSGASKTYTVTIMRAAPPSSNADLSALGTSAGSLNPAFSPANTNYAIDVSAATSSLRLTPTAAENNATININGVATASGASSAPIALSVGANMISVVVAAQNGATSKTYTLTVNRAAASDASLSTLSLAAGALTPALSPAFSPSQFNYSASVSNPTASLTITPTVSDSNASVKVNGLAQPSGTASGAIPLNVGANTVTVLVTAQDGTTSASYTITVTRQGSSNADLLALGVSGASIGPPFNSATTAYSASVSSATTSVSVTPTVAESHAALTVNGIAAASGSPSGAISLAPGSNIVEIIVTAQDGSTKTYSVVVTRAPPSAIATLAALTLSTGTLNPAFAGATTSYTAIVANATASLTVTPTVSDGAASVKVNGTASASGAPSVPIPLNVGSNTVTILVTAQDGTTSVSYTVTVTRQGSGNADLSALSLSGAAVNPSFSPATTSYTASVSSTTTSVTITPTVAEGHAAVRVDGVAVASGSPSSAIPLAPGSNTVDIVVTAQDDSTKTYRIVITRALPSATATLSGLALSAGSLSPAFAAATTAYTANVANAVASMTVTPTVADNTATLKVNGVSVASGSASAAIALDAGTNTITVTVTAQDGAAITSYVITVVRQASADASLSALTLSTGTLAPVFSSGTTAYTASVSAATTSIAFTPTRAESHATIMVEGSAVASGSPSGAIPLAPGTNTIDIVVTAQDESTRTYRIVVTRALPSANASLSGLALSAGTLAPAFASATTAYSATVANAAASLTVTPAVADDSASVKVDGVATASGSASGPIALAVGSNMVTVIVTAENGTSTKAYAITVSRAAPPASAPVASSAPAGAIGATGATLHAYVDPNGATTAVTFKYGATAMYGSSTPTSSVAAGAGNAAVSHVLTELVCNTTYHYTVSATNSAGTSTGGDQAFVTSACPPGAPSPLSTPQASAGNGQVTVSFQAAAPNGSPVTGYTVLSSPPGGVDANAGSIALTHTVTGLANGTAYTFTVIATNSAGSGPTSAPSNSVTPAGGGPAGTASLRGAVYVDVNRNDSFDNGDIPVAGAVLTLSGTTPLGQAVSKSVNSDAAGAYGFSSLAAGTYTLTETQPPDYADFEGAAGTSTGNLGGVAAENRVTAITLASDSAATGYNFRENAGSLAGTVYLDSNQDGVRQVSEDGIAGVTLTLTGIETGSESPAPARSTTTSASGAFIFGGLKAGSYTITETQPSSYLDGQESPGSLGGAAAQDGYDDAPQHNRIAAIAVASGQAGIRYLFGERQDNTLQGYVYVDMNANGVREAGEAGIAGVRVTLSGTAADGSDACAQRSCVASTGPDGGFSFGGMKPGRYVLVKSPADIDGNRYADSRESAGLAGGTVNNDSFGTLPYQNTISGIDITSARLAFASQNNGGKIDGYLFGLAERAPNGPKPPLLSGAVRLHRKAGPASAATNSVVQDWTVELLQNGSLVCSVASGADGKYQFDNLVCPGHQNGLPTGSGFAIRFTKAGSNLLAMPVSSGGAGSAAAGMIGNITLAATDEITGQDLPLDPEGIVYDSVTRQPVQGAVIGIAGPPGFDPARHLVGGASRQVQTTDGDGIYQYLLQGDFPSGVYTLGLRQAPPAYLQGASVTLPPCAATLSVGAAPDPAFIQAGDTAPSAAIASHNPASCIGLVDGGAASTQYYFAFALANGVSAAVLNNHIPLDPLSSASMSLTKSGDRSSAELGDTVRYTLVLSQRTGGAMTQVTLRDALPAGFRFIPGTVTVNGKAAADPSKAAARGGTDGSLLGFNLGPTAPGQQIQLTYRARVGVGSMQGDGINRARAYGCTDTSGCLDTVTLAPRGITTASNEARFRIAVGGGVFTNDACIAGKVFGDCNHNGIQDGGEAGIGTVRLYLEDGTHFTTDRDGKYSFCGLSPRTHVLKVDTLTLPPGSVLEETSNRNLGDPGSLLLDVKNGELIRGDFAEASCSAPVLEEARRRHTGAASQSRPPAGDPGAGPVQGQATGRAIVSFSSRVRQPDAGRASGVVTQLPQTPDAIGSPAPAEETQHVRN